MRSYSSSLYVRAKFRRVKRNLKDRSSAYGQSVKMRCCPTARDALSPCGQNAWELTGYAARQGRSRVLAEAVDRAIQISPATTAPHAGLAKMQAEVLSGNHRAFGALRLFDPFSDKRANEGMTDP